MTEKRARVLIVEDDAAMARQLHWALREDYGVKTANDRPSAVDALARWKPDLVLLDLCIPPTACPDEGFAVLEAARESGADAPVVVMSALEEREPALRAVACGAYDFFTKPVDLDTLRTVIARAIERTALVRENRRLRRELGRRFDVDGIIGASPAMQRVFDAIRRVASSPINVSIQGESGTGKELIARAIHYGGARREGPFVPVHCAAFPENLLEAELFGHERGAFTGADDSRVGRFEAAHGGTLFLDEIACLPLQTQVKLLRVIEDRTIERIGSNRRRAVDIRLVAATNEDLEAKVRRGEFREDLFFRINVFPILVPPLRERLDDVSLLANHFLHQLCAERRIPPKRFAPETLRALEERRWPGNVRELRNVVEAVLLLADDGEVVRPQDLPPAQSTETPPTFERAGRIGFKATVREFERRLLLEALGRSGGVKARAARELQLDPSQMKYLVRKHGL